MLDDGYGETVAIRLGVGHGRSAYPNPVKATQPSQEHSSRVLWFKGRLDVKGVLERLSQVD